MSAEPQTVAVAKPIAPPGEPNAKKRGRVRAHAHPLADSDAAYPSHPDQWDWSANFPDFPAKTETNAFEAPARRVTIADIGSGFGGLLLSMSNVFKDELIVGFEIRDTAAEITQEYIDGARGANLVVRPDGSQHEWDCRNISVINTNMMKWVPNWFAKGQLKKMIFCFQDPHFKHSKERLRTINASYLDQYAYALEVGGILYTITDVEQLYLWQKKHLDEHPLFERIPDEELSASDPCWDLIHTGTHEGCKVSRNGGSKYPACYRRVEYNPEKAKAAGKLRCDLLE